MCKVIIFAGTTEGRQIAEFLNRRKISALICVATEYGEQLLPASDTLDVSHNRLSEPEMESLMREKGSPLVLDATHPYAAEVTENIRKACEQTGSPYVRVLRENTAENMETESLYAGSVEEAVTLLEHTKGNILVTTGSKEAEKYTALSDYKKRVFLRVLSLPNVAQQCAALGFEGRNLICMQGPFSMELNAAMLRQLDCKYLVTKMSGSTGGFQEKIEAARSCGCIPVMIGRPLKEEGISLIQCKRLLCERFSLSSQAEITLVGIGMGSEKSRTREAAEAVRGADLLIGARRMVQSCVGRGQDVYVEYDSEKIGNYIRLHPEYEKIAIVLSGDTGFYSGAEAAAKAFMREGWDVEFVPGVSSLSYFCARLGKSWQNVHPVSSHGRDCDVVAYIRSFKSCFILLGGAGSVPDLCRQLVSSGMSSVTLWAGENFSYEDERIAWQMTPAELLMEDERLPFGSLACVLVENTEAAEGQLYPQPGPQDEDYIRGQVPMTKKEVRRISLDKLCIGSQAVCYDIGAGTGSVAVEMGMEIRKWGGSGQVYAIERNREALQLIESNCQKFHGSWMGFHIVEGEAPEAMKGLEPPTHAFIGGSGGHMREIVAALLDANPHVRIVANAITLETVGEILACMKEFGFATGEITQVWAAPVDTVGSYHMPKAQNPVYVAVMQDPKDDEGEIQWQEL